MGLSREDLMDLGSRVGAPTLIDGGRRVLGAWGDDIDRLTPFGFGEEKRSTLSGMLDDVEHRYREFGGAEGGMVISGMAIRVLFADGKLWIRRVQGAALNAFEGTPLADTFSAEPAVGTSVKRLIRAMTIYTGLADTHANALSAFGVDAAVLENGHNILKQLQRTREEQGKSIAALPESAAELQIAKGNAYLLIKQLSRAARVALPLEQARVYTPTRLFVASRKPRAKSAPGPAVP